ncbi:MAG: apolipoprotein N-acyltransferase [Halanaerobiaceae bacterium]
MIFILPVISAILMLIPAYNPQYYFLAWFALLPLLYGFKSINGRKSLRLQGYIFGVIYFFGISYWIYHPLDIFGGMPLPLALLLLILLAGLLALFFVLWTEVFHLFGGKNSFSPFLLALTWTGIEYFRYLVLSDFPFGFAGYTQAELIPLLQLADIGGVFLISFIVLLVNGYLFKMIYYRRLRSVASLVVLIIIVGAYGGVNYYQYRNQDYEEITTGIVYTDIPQDEKWRSDLIEQRIDELFEPVENKEEVDLFITPESGLTFDYVRNEYYREKFLERLETVNSYFAVGSLSRLQDEETRRYNSVFLFSPKGKQEQRYNKNRLVLFGEYFPLRDYITKVINIPFRNLLSGKEATIFSSPDAAWMTLVCSEVLFPELTASKKADFIANQTNEAWFRKSGLHQLMWSASVFRAVEQRKSVVRAGNRSLNGLVSPSGRQVKFIAEGTTNFKQLDVPLHRKETFYQRFGHRFGLVVLLITGLLLVVRIIPVSEFSK